jgi:hypothetical protein
MEVFLLDLVKILGFGGVVVGFAWFLLTKTVPKLSDDFRREAKEQREHDAKQTDKTCDAINGLAEKIAKCPQRPELRLETAARPTAG